MNICTPLSESITVASTRKVAVTFLRRPQIHDDSPLTGSRINGDRHGDVPRFVGQWNDGDP